MQQHPQNIDYFPNKNILYQKLIDKYFAYTVVIIKFKKKTVY